MVRGWIAWGWRMDSPWSVCFLSMLYESWIFFGDCSYAEYVSTMNGGALAQAVLTTRAAFALVFGLGMTSLDG